MIEALLFKDGKKLYRFPGSHFGILCNHSEIITFPSVQEVVVSRVNEKFSDWNKRVKLTLKSKEDIWLFKKSEKKK